VQAANSSRGVRSSGNEIESSSAGGEKSSERLEYGVETTGAKQNRNEAKNGRRMMVTDNVQFYTTRGDS